MENNTRSEKKGKSRKSTWRIILFVLAVLIVIRIFLPYIVLRYVNNKLAGLENYYGHVEDIDLALIRGAYVIEDINIVKISGKDNQRDSIPFFKSSEMDLSVEWNAIFNGALVGEIVVVDPVLNFIKDGKEEVEKGDTADFRKIIKDLMPLTINRFEIENGEIHFRDPTVTPAIDIAMKEIYALALNLSNRSDSSRLLPASLEAAGRAYEGRFTMSAKFDAFSKVPVFDLNAELQNLNLVLMNDFLRAYGNFDVKQGRFGLYTEFAARNGEFGGYVKPLITDLDIVQWKEEEGNFGQILWESLIGSVAEIFENQKEDQLGSKIPINGKFNDPDINLWRAISFVLRNAFVNALQPSIDRSINIRKLEEKDKKTFLEKVFGDDKNKKEE